MYRTGGAMTEHCGRAGSWCGVVYMQRKSMTSSGETVSHIVPLKSELESLYADLKLK